MEKELVLLILGFLKVQKMNCNKKRNHILLRKSLLKENLAVSLLDGINYVVGLINLNYRRIWMKPRSNEMWLIMLNNYTDTDWLENFRMKKDSFILLCDLLRPSLQPKEQIVKSREPLSVEKQVAVCIYKLCSCSEYRVVGAVFGIHKSTVRKCLLNVTNAIIKHMMPTYLKMSNEFEVEEISLHFESVNHIPMLMGAIDGTHIPITPPRDGYRDFINRKGWASYNVLAVVDHKCRFQNVFVQYPGSVHDATVLKGSNLYKCHKKVLPQVEKLFHGINLNYMIVGDAVYPLLNWIIKEFSGACTPEEESFNVYLNAARVVVEWAFGRLKARFRILLKRMDMYYKSVSKVIIGCCILHNFIEDRKEIFVQQWLKDVEEVEIMLPQPRQPLTQHAAVGAVEKRRRICDYLAANFPIKTSSLR